MSRLRRLAGLFNPFQPIRGDRAGAMFLTVVAAWTLGVGVHHGHPVTIAIGAAESLICPLGPAAYMLYQRVRR